MEKRKNDIMEEIKKTRSEIDKLQDTNDGNILNESEISRKEATVDAKYLRDLEAMGKLDTPLVSAGLPHESVLVDINPKDGKQKLKSGRIMTRSSTVVNDVQWPHMKVLPRLNVKGEIRFDDINHWELIEGELIILNELSCPTDERNYRSLHLQELVHYAGIYQWKSIMQYHGAYLEDIEQGRRNWHDSKSELKERYLYPHAVNANLDKIPEQPRSVSKEARFCYDFQKEKCVRERCRFKHICRPCFQVRQKVEQHPACRCPHKDPEYRTKVESLELSLFCKKICLFLTYFTCCTCILLFLACDTNNVKYCGNGQSISMQTDFKYDLSHKLPECRSNDVKSSCGKPCIVPYIDNWDGYVYEVTSTWCCEPMILGTHLESGDTNKTGTRGVSRIFERGGSNISWFPKKKVIRF